MMNSQYDVVVVGGGHAGCEAAAAAARMGAKVALVTHRFATVGAMSCNPAIGGLGKGHLVREIDALDGLMGRVADLAGIQFRVLNRRKGPAVRGPRAQADRRLYARAMQRAIGTTANLTVIEAEADDLVVCGERIGGLKLADGRELRAGAVVLTTGTFLRGLIHIGERQTPAGRVGEAPALGLSLTLQRLGFALGRLKTGTPPRLDGRTIDWAAVEMQPGDEPPEPFSMLTKRIDNPQVQCGITRTNAATHRIIRDNVHRSPMYSGQISSKGPRYCPSIEDKIVRFADRDRHQIFVEPEGRNHPWIYLNGISTSLPAEVQVEIVRSIRGLERAEVARAGYAVEYDFVQPTVCRHTLETKSVRGLFLAGQINGTTGYEEAAALGLVAGINAALQVRREPPLVLSRGEAYIGVLVDDLVLKGTAEPYRMFTSRAEYRLLLDIDSADLRLTGHGRRIGLVGDERYARFVARRDGVRSFERLLETLTLTPTEETRRRVEGTLGVRITEPTTPALLLRRCDVSLEGVERFLGDAVPQELSRRDRLYVASRMRYGGYVERQEKDLERLRREEGRGIPPGFEYEGIPGLSREVVEKLERARPATLAQAGRISGVTPAALSLINIHLEKRRRSATYEAGTGPSRPPRRTDSRCISAESGSPIPRPPADRA